MLGYPQKSARTSGALRDEKGNAGQKIGLIQRAQSAFPIVRLEVSTEIDVR